MRKALLRGFLLSALITTAVQCFVFQILPWEFTEGMRAFLALSVGLSLLGTAGVYDVKYH